MNKAFLIGNLTKDPVVRTTRDGTSVATFTVAAPRNYKNAEGKRDADFIMCVAWRKTAEFIQKYFQKGSRIVIDGAIRTRTYEDDTGTRRYVTEVIVDNAEFGGGGAGKGGTGAHAEPDKVFGNDADPDFVPLEEAELPF